MRTALLHPRAVAWRLLPLALIVSTPACTKPDPAAEAQTADCKHLAAEVAPTFSALRTHDTTILEHMKAAEAQPQPGMAHMLHISAELIKAGPALTKLEQLSSAPYKDILIKNDAMMLTQATRDIFRFAQPGPHCQGFDCQLKQLAAWNKLVRLSQGAHMDCERRKIDLPPIRPLDPSR